MEFIDELIILLLFLFPVISRLFGKKTRPGQHQAPSAESASSPSSTGDPLTDALRQIREALGEAEPEPTPAPPKPRPERPRPVSPERTPKPERHGLGAFERDERGFGRSNPLSEEVFERKPEVQRRGGTDRIEQKPLKQVDLTTPIEVKQVAPTSRSGLADALRDPARAREAFALREVLGPPRSLRPRR